MSYRDVTTQDYEDEVDEVPQQLGIALEPSVHCSVIITCAEASQLNTLAGYLRAAFCIVVVLISFALQGILIGMISKVAEDPIEGKLSEFCFTARPARNGSLWNKPWSGIEGSETWGTAACNGTDWTFQEDAVGKMKDFFGDYDLGFLFGLVALVIWNAAIFQEFAAIVNYSGLYHLPSPEDALPEVNKFVNGYVKEANNGKLVCLSPWIKAMAFVITVLRTAVAIALLLVGVEFLSHTTDLKDFVLNSLALAFVLQIDEIAFAILVPRHHRSKATDIDEPVIDSDNYACFELFKFWVGYSDIITCLGIIVGTSVAGYFWLWKFQLRYRTAFCLLGCESSMCNSHGMTYASLCNKDWEYQSPFKS